MHAFAIVVGPYTLAKTAPSPREAARLALRRLAELEGGIPEIHCVGSIRVHGEQGETVYLPMEESLTAAGLVRV